MTSKTKMDTNPAKIPWPTDRWGFTRELRAAIKTVAARVKGDVDKKAILDETMDIAREFLEVNFESGARTRKKALDAAIKRDAAAAKAMEPKKAVKQGTKPKADDQLALFDLDDE